MIYIHRDWSIIPQDVIDALREAANTLDEIQDAEARKEFISENAERWSALRDYLSQMSHGKCWYSEARECVSRYQVDHFRPHGRAKQAPKTFSEGYSWLAFDIENFRLAGVLCNTLNREHSDETVGKGDWFPLIAPETRATILDRNTVKESPVLLDPIESDDCARIIFNDDGSPTPNLDLDKERTRADSTLDSLSWVRSKHAEWREALEMERVRAENSQVRSNREETEG